MGEDYTEEINKIVNNAFEKLNFDGRQRVKNEGKELSSSHLKEAAQPEPFTKKKIIEKIISLLDLKILPEKYVDLLDVNRWVDYRLKNQEGGKFLLEAKPLNANLYKDDENGAVNQIKKVFKLAEIRDEHEFGIATDGIKWVFLNNKGEKVEELDIRKDFHKVRKYLSGEKGLISQKEQEEITDKFYQWYDALLHGGKYKNHEDKTRKISKEDCFINNIYHAKDEDKEEIAQVIMNRLIFIKFLQSKGIVKFDVLEYLSELNENELNSKMDTFFFEVFNQPKEDRVNIPDKFEDIPYLNGNLFKRTQVERDNPGYQVKYNILVKVVDFLDGFSFVHKESMEEKEAIDPKILGYIFERAMTAAERKSTGAYYTPKAITKYIAENTVYPVLLEKVNNFLKEERGYKEEELLDDINELYTKVPGSLWEIRQRVLIEDFKVVDPACGSGAFLLAVADILWEIYMNIAERTNKGFSEYWLKREILKHNIYGVDINPNAIEIARLRLWLWLVDSYNTSKKKDVKPLPNLDTKIKTGNSLVGYGDVSELDKKMNNLNNFRNKLSLPKLLEKKKELVKKYNEAPGQKEKRISEKLENTNEGLKTMLDYKYYLKLNEEAMKIDEDNLQSLNPFHWGSEFIRVFDPEKPEDKRGFDVVVGNPPYIPIVKMGAPDFEKEIYKHKYKTYFKSSDYYTLFYERSKSLMTSGSFLGFISKKETWKTGFSFKPFRKMLLDFGRVNIIDFQKRRVFNSGSDGPRILTNIIFTKKTDSKDNEVTLKKINDDDDYIDYSDYEIIKGEFKDREPWNFIDSEIWQYIRNTTKYKLGERHNEDKENALCYVYQGVRVGEAENSIFQEKPQYEEYKDYVYDFVKGSFIKRGFIDESKYIININKIDNDKFLDKLNLETKNFDNYSNEKVLDSETRILVPMNSPPNNFAIKYGKTIHEQSCLGLVIKPDYQGQITHESLRLILNSSLLNYIISLIIPKRDVSEIYDFHTSNIIRIPIKIPENNKILDILSRYDISLKNTKVENGLKSNFFKKIKDSVVYELYLGKEIGTDITALINNYIKDISNLDSEKEKIKTIKEVLNKLNKDEKVEEEIKKIESNGWVQKIEEEI